MEKGETDMSITGIKSSGRGVLNPWALCFMAVIISAWVLTSVVQAGEVTRNFKVNNWITKIQFIPIPDSPGRVIGFYERQGDVVYEDGETAKQLLRCTFDMVKGLGPFQGYSQLIFKDGSTAMVKVQGVMTKPKEGKLPAGHGTGKYIGGTGRFKGIQGKNIFKVRMLKPLAGESKGDALVEVTATYSLPGK